MIKLARITAKIFSNNCLEIESQPILIFFMKSSNCSLKFPHCPPSTPTKSRARVRFHNSTNLKQENGSIETEFTYTFEKTE